jgi:hypothetical protein
MLLGIVRPSGEMDDHRVAVLELRESSKDPSLVLELVVRKGCPNNDVFSQPIALFGPLAPRRARPIPPDTGETWVQPHGSTQRRHSSNYDFPNTLERHPVEVRRDALKSIAQ